MQVDQKHVDYIIITCTHLSVQVVVVEVEALETRFCAELAAAPFCHVCSPSGLAAPEL